MTQSPLPTALLRCSSRTQTTSCRMSCKPRVCHRRFSYIFHPLTDSIHEVPLAVFLVFATCKDVWNVWCFWRHITLLNKREKKFSGSTHFLVSVNTVRVTDDRTEPSRPAPALTVEKVGHISHPYAMYDSEHSSKASLFPWYSLFVF